MTSGTGAGAAALEALARAAERAATRVRSQVPVVAGAAGTDWRGPAARRFRDSLDDHGSALGACAHALDQLASAASTHAATARATGVAAS